MNMETKDEEIARLRAELAEVKRKSSATIANLTEELACVVDQRDGAYGVVIAKDTATANAKLAERALAEVDMILGVVGADQACRSMMLRAIRARMEATEKRAEKAEAENAAVWQQLKAERELVQKLHTERVALEAEVAKLQAAMPRAEEREAIAVLNMRANSHPQEWSAILCWLARNPAPESAQDSDSADPMGWWFDGEPVSDKDCY